MPTQRHRDLSSPTPNAEPFLAFPSLAVPRGLALICMCSASWAFHFGLATQLTTLWLKDLKHSNTVIGLNQGLYYFGLAAVVTLVPTLMRRWGSRCPITGMAVSGVATILFPHAGSLAGWYTLRFLSGAASAMSLIPLETYISRNARPEHRSRDFGFYAVALTVGGGLGIGLGPNLFAPGAYLPFWVAGGVVCLGAVAFLAYRGNNVERVETPEVRPPVDVSQTYLSYGTAWSQGFLEGGMLAFLSLYLLSLGLSAEAAGIMLGASMIGILLMQVPVSWLGDRLGRTPVLLACYAVVAVGLAVLPWCMPGVWLVAWLFLVGGCSGAFYPLGMALLGDRDSETGVARAYAWYMILEAVGSQLGPPLMGIARDWWGEGAMFAVGESAIVLVLASWAIVALASRARARSRKGASARGEASCRSDAA
jgi:MFS family permease